MALINKLEAIGDAIRSKTGKSGKMTLDQMPTEIASIVLGGGTVEVDGLKPSDIPRYIKQAVGRMPSVYETSGSIISFVCCSDAHQDMANANITTANEHCGMALLSYLTREDKDFVAYLGDFSWGSTTNTVAELKEQIEKTSACIDQAFDGQVQFRTIGNHDVGEYSGVSVGNAYLSEKVFSKNTGATFGSQTVGYCYRDFVSKKIRVICLNTADGSKESMSATQLLWFANTLKATPTGYGIIVLSHHPLDWGNIILASSIVKAYVSKESVQIDANNTVSFSDRPDSYFIANVHGHTHCTKIDRLHYLDGGTGKPYKAYRIAIPQMCFTRSNEYGKNGNAEYYGIEFGDDTTPTREINQASETSFAVVQVSTFTGNISVSYYGAYTGTVSVNYKTDVTTPLAIVTQPQSQTVDEGTAVTFSVTATGDNLTYTWFAIVGEDEQVNVSNIGLTNGNSTLVIPSAMVTAQYSGISTYCVISDGNGTVVSNIATLTINASAPSNLIEAYGYTDGVRLSTSAGTEKAQAGYFTTGFIPIKGGDVLTLKGGVSWNGSAHANNAIALFGNTQGFVSATYLTNNTGWSGGTIAINGDEATYTINPNYKDNYVKFTGYGSGANAIVTKNEQIV